MAADVGRSTAVITVGSVAGAALLAPTTGATPTVAVLVALFIGSSVHIAASYWLFTIRDVRQIALRSPMRYLVVPACLVAASTTIAAAISAHQLDLLLLGYFGWQLHHYQRQNLGIAALTAASHRSSGLTRPERRILGVSGWLGIAALLLHPGVLQLASVDWHPTTAYQVLTVGFAGWGLIGTAVLTRRHASDRPASFCLAYLVALYFPLPLFMFGSPYSAIGGLTIAHGLQYLLLVAKVTAGDASHPARPGRLGWFASFVTVGGLVLAAASHLHHGGTIARTGYGAYLGLVMSHFVIDAGIWRMRDPDVRRYLRRCLPELLNPARDVSGDGVESPPWQGTISAASVATPALQR